MREVFAFQRNSCAQTHSFHDDYLPRGEITVGLSFEIQYVLHVTTLRLPKRLEEKLKHAAESAGETKSSFIRKLIEERLQEESKKETLAWELGETVFGKHGSGQGNLAKDRKAILKKKLKAKNAGNH